MGANSITQLEQVLASADPATERPFDGKVGLFMLPVVRSARILLATALGIGACTFPEYDLTDASVSVAGTEAVAGTSSGGAGAGGIAAGPAGAPPGINGGDTLQLGGAGAATDQPNRGAPEQPVGIVVGEPGQCGTCAAPAACFCCGYQCYCSVECDSDDTCTGATASTLDPSYDHCTKPSDGLGICAPQGACGG